MVGFFLVNFDAKSTPITLICLLVLSGSTHQPDEPEFSV